VQGNAVLPHSTAQPMKKYGSENAKTWQHLLRSELDHVKQRKMTRKPNIRSDDGMMNWKMIQKETLAAESRQYRRERR